MVGYEEIRKHLKSSIDENTLIEKKELIAKVSMNLGCSEKMARKTVEEFVNAKYLEEFDGKLRLSRENAIQLLQRKIVDAKDEKENLESNAQMTFKQLKSAALQSETENKELKNSIENLNSEIEQQRNQVSQLTEDNENLIKEKNTSDAELEKQREDFNIELKKQREDFDKELKIKLDVKDNEIKKIKSDFEDLQQRFDIEADPKFNHAKGIKMPRSPPSVLVEDAYSGWISFALWVFFWIAFFVGLWTVTTFSWNLGTGLYGAVTNVTNTTSVTA